MTSKDFQLIAETIREIPDYDTRRDVAKRFAVTLLTANGDRFDALQFVGAATGMRTR